LSEHPDIPTLNLSGTPAQIGEAHGEAAREKIKDHTDRFLELLLSRAVTVPDEESLWSKWSPQVSANERFAPDLVEEMRGIARGSGVSFERIFLLNSLLDLVSFYYADMAENFGCTSFAVSRAAGSGGTLVGQTYDMPEIHQDFLILLRIEPQQGPRQLVFSFAGIVGAAGLNEAGIGLSINYLSPLDVGVGRLHSVVVRQVLGARNLANALAPPVQPPRAGGAHFLIADQDGNVVSIETTAKRYEVFYPEDNVYGHTNHYLGHSLKGTEYIRRDSIGSSLARYTALRRYLRESGNELDLERLKELTRNHTSFPQSICTHGRDTDPQERRTRSLSAMVHELDKRTIHITNGCACESRYHPVSL